MAHDEDAVSHGAADAQTAAHQNHCDRFGELEELLPAPRKGCWRRINNARHRKLRPRERPLGAGRRAAKDRFSASDHKLHDLSAVEAQVRQIRSTSNQDLEGPTSCKPRTTGPDSDRASWKRNL